ncbi:MAG: hypothetical protein KAU52_05230, partial [Methanosarcinales archaeon]|nr:hypothetical protein [Methanosarcinales archaeon]
MNTKKIAASVVGIMLIATVLAMAVSAAGMDRRDYANDPRMVYEFDADTDTGIYINDQGYAPVGALTVANNGMLPTLRIFGETGAIYPTQSMTGTLDFIYPDAVDPFDPGVIEKDSVTFNPAYIENMYGNTEITVDGFNGDEKVFLRTFYEPGYYHGIDEKMNEPGHGTDSVYMRDGALVVETTYMLLADNGADTCHSGLPMAGAAKDTHGNVITYFMLPTHSSNFKDETGGMDVAKIVDLNYASGMGTSKLTDGEIAVQLSATLDEDDAVKFMDHKIRFNAPTFPDYNYTLDIQYTGNMKFVEDRKQTVTVNQGDTHHVDRLNNLHPVTDPDYRFYFNVERMYKDADGNYKVDITVGRHLAAGETFYVDGVRYDMPAIYVTDDDKFKYITFQTPLPKCYGDVWYDVNEDNQADKSHVTCQWLANLLRDHDVWVLPPFNDNHLMIDDIDLDEYSCTTGGHTVSDAGVMIGKVGELEFCYIDEATEDRFDSNLAERHARKDGVQLWNWWDVNTKPNAYTELVLPDQEQYGDYYIDACGYNVLVDGNEYLVTTSFIAPNSEADDRHADCKPDDTHDIIDRAATIGAVAGDTSRDDYAGMPRMVFEYDAYTTDDLFVNDDGTGNATVRVYGEAGAIYPTHTLHDTRDFIYPNAVDPFDPGVIAKDSVTFNPAYIENMYGTEITVDGNNGDEKVFLRTFYEPGYGHGIDEKMNEPGHGTDSVSMPRGALVVETTYMLLADNGADTCQSGLPMAGAARDTHGNVITYFMLPTHSSGFNDDTGGMDVAKIVDLNYASGMGTSNLTDGEIAVQRSVTLDEDDAVKFMDHKIRFNTPTFPGYDITLDIQYTGNMRFVEDRKKTKTVNQGQTYHVDRLNGLHPVTDPDY